MKKRYSLLPGLITTAFLLAIINPTAAQTPGDPDPSFGQNGQVIQNLSQSFELAYGCAVLPDGKIVAAGDLWTGRRDFVFASRYLPDGSPDPGFASNGHAIFGNDTTDYLPFDMKMQADGKILTAGFQFDGQSLNGFVARMLPNGDPDPGFGNGGVFIYDALGSFDRFYAVELDANGRILAAGSSNMGMGNEAVVVRLLPNGTPDASFGANGTAKLDVLTGTGSSIFYDLDILLNGSVVCVGSRSGGVGIVARFNGDGSPFTGFNSDGLLELDNAEGFTQLYAVSVQNNSQFVVAGYRNLAFGRAFLIARVLANGNLDNTFASNGVSQLLIGSSNTVRDVMPLSDGKILACGHLTTPDGTTRAALIRFDSDGTSDGTFTTLIPEQTSAFYHLELLPDNKILACGYSADSAGYDLALAKYLPNGLVDAGFGASGAGWAVHNLRNGTEIMHELALGTDGKVWTGNELSVTDRYALTRFTAEGVFESNQIAPEALEISPFLSDLVIQNDGKLVLGGSASNDQLGFARWLPDGSPDPSFGNQGIWLTSVDSLIYITFTAMTVQADSKLLVLFDATTPTDFSTYDYLARYWPDGTPDAGWNGTGRLNLSEIDFSFNSHCIRIQPDQKILVGGSANYGEAAFAARFLPDGTPDPSFGNAGTVILDQDTHQEIVHDLNFDAEGRILAAFFSDQDNYSTGLLRLLPNGDPDPTFGDNGRVLTPNEHIPAAYEDLYYEPRVAVQSNGRILLGTYRGASADFALYCFLSNGQPDPEFGLNGLSRQDLQGNNDLPTALAILPDGGILQGGSSSNGFDQDIALVRYLPNLSVGAPEPGDGPIEVLVYPNPLSPGSALKYVNPQPGSVTVQLEDAQGRRVQTCFSGWQAAGEQTIDLHPAPGLAAGWYVCRVVTASGEVAVKVVVR